MGWLGSPQRIAQAEAVQLFLARARAVQPDFDLTVANAAAVVQICARLDGLPLALELAAARLALLTPAEIATRLHDRFALLSGGRRVALPRHQTLRALIEWSYELLTEPERALLRQLSVFAAGFSLEMLEAIAQSLPSELQTSLVDLLASLVNKSLVQAETAVNTTRYTLLETIRQYAAEKREATGETAAAKDRLLAYFHTFAGEAEKGLRGPQQQAWLNRAQQELGNIRAMLEWALIDMENKARVAQGMAIVFNLGYYWVRRGRAEWQEWMARYAALRDPPLVPAYCHEALAIARALNDGHGASWALSNLSQAALGKGDFDRAVALGEESLALELRLGFDEILAMRRYRLGMAYLFRGDHTQAKACFRENLAFKQAREILWGEPGCHLGLGELARQQGELARARAHLEAAFQGFQEMDYKYGLASAVERLAHLAVDETQFATAAWLFAAADGLRASYGMALLPIEQTAHDRAVATVRGALSEHAHQTAVAAVSKITAQAIVGWINNDSG